MSNAKRGRVLKLLAGFYFVDLPDGLVRCRARGKLRSMEEAPAVGDMVVVELINEEEGTLMEILPRRNFLDRPAVANIDQLVVMASFAAPDPNRLLLDRLLVTGEHLGLRIVLCINKADLRDDPDLAEPYKAAGYPVVQLSLTEDDDLTLLYRELQGRVSVLAGQSGVGKSSLLRRMKPGLEIVVGKVSDKSRLGRHTTRHVELIHVLEWNAYIVDTPGFSRLDLPADMKSVALSDYYPEMEPLRAHCRFTYDCSHRNEPGCRVKAGVAAGEISQLRYDNYLMLFAELSERERSQYR